MNTKIPIHVSNHRAFIWDVEDLGTLRSEHHICGLLIGTIPHLSQQNVFLGVPLVLMPEEVVLLVEKEFAILVDDANAHDIPTADELLSWKEVRDQEIRSYIAEAEKAKGSTASKKALSEEALAKRRKREELRSARLQAVGTQVEENILVTPESSKPESSAEAAAPAYPVVISTLSSEVPWYRPQARSYDTIEAAKAAGIWSYPDTLHERAKCAVFRDLWTKANFIGGGMKFGGDYLVYPGDPLSLRPMEIVAFGRLGTATKKSHLLCGWNEETDEVSCYSIEWAGFG